MKRSLKGASRFEPEVKPTITLTDRSRPPARKEAAPVAPSASQLLQIQSLLGIPSHVAVAAVMPLGRPVKQLTKLKRKAVEEFAMLDRWGGLPLK